MTYPQNVDQAIAEFKAALPGWFKRRWCNFFHGGGLVKRDPCGRVNWQCIKCGRWSDPVPIDEELWAIEAAYQNRLRDVQAQALAAVKGEG